MNNRTLLGAALTATLAACNSMPERNGELDQAHERFAAAQTNLQVTTLAAEELQRAGETLRDADRAWQDRRSATTVDHLAYMTIQRVEIARETASSRASLAIIAGAAAQRDKMRLAARTDEVGKAQQRLEEAQEVSARKSAALRDADAQAQRDRDSLAARANEADMAQQQLAVVQASDARKSTELAEADAAARRALARTAAREARVADLEMKLKDLNARRTDRGMVVTLGDVLFDTGRARILSTGSRSMVKLAEFFKRNPGRTASIEGYTDNTGSAGANVSLSERRADAVKTALVDLGVSTARLRTQAHGADDPVATNATVAGRQLNRRVEIVFANPPEDVSAN